MRANTGLPGLSPFHAAITEALVAHPGCFAVVLIDVAHVLTANLAHGWRGGNEVIEGQAARISQVRNGQPMWHLGGDHFASIVVADTSAEARRTAVSFGVRLEREMAAPILHGDVELPTSVSATVVTPAADAVFEDVAREIQLVQSRGWSAWHRIATDALSPIDSVQGLAAAIATLGVESLNLACVFATVGTHEFCSGERPPRDPDGVLPTAHPAVRVEWWVRDDGLADLDSSTAGIGGFVEPIAAAIDARAELLLSIEVERTSADRDFLTGLLNRRGFMRRVEQMDRPFTIVFADLDRLKEINDQHGHDAGDRALQRVASMLSDGRAGDVVARWGGEEFVVALADTDSDGTATWLRRLIEAGRHTDVPQVTFSAGVVACPDGGSVEAAITQADEALYRAKDAGRAMVIVA